MTTIELHDFPLWTDLSQLEINELLTIVTVRGYARGDLLFRPGDDPNCLILLQHGRVKTYMLSLQGHEKIMHVFKPGDAFGGLLMGAVNDELPWAQAMDDVVACIMDEPAFMRFMQRCPSLCLSLFRYQAAHHAEDMQRIERLLHTKSNHRVVLTLLDLGHRLGYDDEEAFPITPFTHEDIGNMIGMVRSTVSETISQLRKQGIVSGTGPRMSVHRRVAERFLESE